MEEAAEEARQRWQCLDDVEGLSVLCQLLLSSRRTWLSFREVARGELRGQDGEEEEQLRKQRSTGSGFALCSCCLCCLCCPWFFDAALAELASIEREPRVKEGGGKSSRAGECRRCLYGVEMLLALDLELKCSPTLAVSSHCSRSFGLGKERGGERESSRGSWGALTVALRCRAAVFDMLCARCTPTLLALNCSPSFRRWAGWDGGRGLLSWEERSEPLHQREATC